MVYTILRRIIRLLLQFILASIGGFAGYVFIFLVMSILGLVASLLNFIIHILLFPPLGFTAMLVIYIGMPAGSLLGIFLSDRFIFRIRTYGCMAAVIGYIFSVFTMASIIVLPWITKKDLFVFIAKLDEWFYPFISALTCVIGYNLLGLITRETCSFKEVFARQNILIMGLSSLLAIFITAYVYHGKNYGGLDIDLGLVMLEIAFPVLMFCAWFFNRSKNPDKSRRIPL